MDLPHKRPTEAGWLHQAWVRGLTWWPAKMIGIALGMTLFFAAYFWVLRHPLFPVTTMPLTVVDRLVSFQPEALLLYLSLWFYVSLAPALLINRRELVSYALAAVGISIIGWEYSSSGRRPCCGPTLIGRHILHLPFSSLLTPPATPVPPARRLCRVHRRLARSFVAADEGRMDGARVQLAVVPRYSIFHGRHPPACRARRRCRSRAGDDRCRGASALVARFRLTCLLAGKFELASMRGYPCVR